MGLGEWRGRRTAISEAIDKKLTPEQKLVLARNKRDRNLNWLIATIAISISILVGLSALDAISQTDSVMEAYFGENVWRDIRESGHNPNWPFNIVVGCIAVTFAMWGISTFRTLRAERQLEHEIFGEAGEAE